ERLRPFFFLASASRCTVHLTVFRRALLGFLLALVLPAQLLAQQPDTGSIVGELRLPRGGFPPRRLQVSLETRGATINTTYSDDEGKFFFPGLQGNVYHVVINESEYYPVNEIVPFNPFVNRTKIVSIHIIPRDDSSGTTEPVAEPGANAHMMDHAGGGAAQQPVSGGNPYLVNLSEYAKKFPKAVVKEFEKAGKQEREGNLDSAIEHFQKALKMAPDFYPAHNDLGSVYVRKGDFALAEGEFNEVLRLNPSDATAYFNLGNVALLTKRFPEGLRYVGEGLQKQPNSAAGLFIQGSLFRQSGKFVDAERALRQALAADPSFSKAHLELVNLYRQQDRKNDLIAELQTFLRLFPSDPLAPRVKDTLNKLGVPAGSK